MKNKRIQGLFLAVICTLGLQIRALEPEILDRVAQERENLKSSILEHQQAVTRKSIMLATGGVITMLASGAYCFNHINEGNLQTSDMRKLVQSITKLVISASFIGAGCAGIVAATESLMTADKDQTLEMLERTTNKDLRDMKDKASRQSRDLDKIATGAAGIATMYASAGYFLHTLVDENLSLLSVPHLIAAVGMGAVGGFATLFAMITH